MSFSKDRYTTLWSRVVNNLESERFVVVVIALFKSDVADIVKLHCYLFYKGCRERLCKDAFASSRIIKYLNACI